MEYDIIISGAGIVGLLTALGLAKTGLRVVIIEYKTLVELKNINDERVYAIAHGSRMILEELLHFVEIISQAQPILDIVIGNGQKPLLLYEHTLVGTQPIGYVIQSKLLYLHVLTTVLQTQNITLIAREKNHTVITHTDKVIIHLSNNMTICAPLLINAQGRNSKLRRDLNFPVVTHDYRQTALLFNITHTNPHNNTAWELFLPSGPFAFLPMQGKNRSTVIWTEKSDLATMFTQLSHKDLTYEVNKRCGKYLGEISIINKLTAHSLKLCYAKNFYMKRVVLLGDAAHAIHPIAGQGLNLAIRDLACLIKTIAFWHKLKVDIGTATVMQQFIRERRKDVVSMIIATDLINRLFSNKALALKIFSSLGLVSIQNLSVVKKFFMKKAMGLRG